MREIKQALAYIIVGVCGRACSNGAAWGASQVLALITSIFILGASAVKSHAIDWDKFRSSLGPTFVGFAIVFVIFCGWHYFKAQWQLHKEAQDRIKELENRPSDPLFHPYVDRVGRHIQSAAWGSAKKPSSVVTVQIEKHFRDGLLGIPVNNDELGVKLQDDPDRGNDNKFLTVTYTETLKQGQVLELPFKWLGTQRFDAIPQQIYVRFSDLRWSQRIALWKILRAGITSDTSVKRFLEAKGFATPDEIIKAVCDGVLVIRDSNGNISANTANTQFLNQLFVLEPPSSGLDDNSF
jgi:hypothetical protein